MPERMYRSFQGLLLLGVGILFAYKAANGQLTWYINSRFVPLTIFGILFLILLAQVVFAEIRRSRREDHHHEHHHGHDHDHDHAPASINLWVMLVPLAIGILIPARPLDSSAFASKGVNTSAPLASADSSTHIDETDSENRNVLDWIKIFYYETDLSPFIGQNASVVGFVYFDETLNANQFFVSRFVVSCCAADGFAIAMPVDWDGAPTLEEDAWVLVKGTIDSVELNGRIVPKIVAESVSAAPVPDQPYLFP